MAAARARIILRTALDLRRGAAPQVYDLYIMYIMRILRILGLGLLLTLLRCSPAGLAKVETSTPLTEQETGVVVESVSPESTGARAGLQPEDVILSWSCAAAPPTFPQPASGTIRSPYDLLPLETEESPRRVVTLHGKRGNEEMAWSLGSADWGLGVRPVLPAKLAALYLEGKSNAGAGDLAAAARSWRSAAESARTAGDSRLAAWFLNRLAGALAAVGKWPESDAAYQETLAELDRASDHPAYSQLLRAWGGTLKGRGDWSAAIERYQKALELDRTMAPKSLAVAVSLDDLGVAAAQQGRYAAAEEHLRQALAIREELAPGTTEIAASLNKLGILARLRGDLGAAEESLLQAEELQRRLAPASYLHSLILMNLGNVAKDRGDLKRAESLHRQALAIAERIDPGNVAGHLQNLANVLCDRGNLAAAEDLYRRILALEERQAPEGAGVWRAIISLGHIAWYRKDLEVAETYYLRGLTLAERLFPEGREVALSLKNLGDVALLRGDVAKARGFFQRVGEIEEGLDVRSVDVAVDLDDLARLEMVSGGNLAAAETLLRRALTMLEEVAPESMDASSVLRHLGEVVSRRGRPQEALALLRRALDLQSRLAPGSTGEAEALYELGRTERRAGQFREGIRDLCRAIDVLDRQRARLGGIPEEKTFFEAGLADYYHACLEGLIEAGRPAEAFHVLERGRARSFLALLAERDLRFSDLPLELAAERRRVNAEYDHVQSQLASLNASRDGAEVERLTGELRDLRARQEEILARMRREAPRSAALVDPEPLDLTRARAALDPGTVLLKYAVGQEKSWLFVVDPAAGGDSGLSVFRIDSGAESLRDEVEGLRLLLKNPGSDPAELRARARRLYDLLVRPAEARIAGAQRVLVSADGPLHTLPFAALVRGGRYLIEWKPLHSVLSTTVYAELTRSRKPRQEPGDMRLAAFGDPVYPPLTPAASADPEVREAVRRGLSLRPLPFSAQEVKSLADLFPRAEVYLGHDATEERAKSIAPEARLIHFACHGVLDEHFPLNSALALTLPEQFSEGRDNGLLQAWEIFESMRLDADLVTLSACDTALGREMAGEGLIGLTRAFQYAGARSVLASLWEVSDRSTARFMKSFYGYLRGGKSKDEALRAAQIDQVRGDMFSHPFHWAAFQLTGDWQ